MQLFDRVRAQRLPMHHMGLELSRPLKCPNEGTRQSADMGFARLGNAGIFVNCREMAASIDASGGTMSVEALIADVRSRLRDVAESSIRTNLTSLAFISDGAMVRRRAESDELPPVAPLYTARGAFRNGDNEIRLAMPVNSMCCGGRASRSIPR